MSIDGDKRIYVKKNTTFTMLVDVYIMLIYVDRCKWDDVNIWMLMDGDIGVDGC